MRGSQWQTGRDPASIRAVEAGVDRENESASRSVFRRRMSKGLIVFLAVLVVVYAALISVAGGWDLLLEASSINIHLLALPAVATLLSYLTMSRSYEGISRAAGTVIPALEMLRITFVANSANYILPSGGLSGFALRLLFFRRRGISAGRAVAISFTQTLLTNLMLMVFIVYGLVNLMFTSGVDDVSLTAAGVLALILTAILVLSVVMIYSSRFRLAVLDFSGGLADRLLDATGYSDRFSARLARLLAHLNDGMALFARRPAAMVLPCVWIFLDWLFMIGALYLGFYAVGDPVPFSVVTIAFSVSIVFAVVSFVPGGAGVLESVLAATFADLGVPIRESLLPIFLYRASYFLLPALLSLVLARGAFVPGDTAAEEAL